MNLFTVTSVYSVPLFVVSSPILLLFYKNVRFSTSHLLAVSIFIIYILLSLLVKDLPLTDIINPSFIVFGFLLSNILLKLIYSKNLAERYTTTIFIFTLCYFSYGIYEVVAQRIGFPDFFHVFRNNPMFVISYDSIDGASRFVMGGWATGWIEGNFARANGFYSEPSHAGFLILYFVIYLYCRYVTKLTSLVGFSYVLMSLSRTNWIIYLVAKFISNLSLRKTYYLVAIQFLIALISLSFLEIALDDYDLSIIERLGSIFIGIRIWLENFLFGAGPSVVQKYVSQATMFTETHSSIILSGLISKLADWGLVGTLLIYCLFKTSLLDFIDDKKSKLLVINGSIIAFFLYDILFFISTYFYLVAMVLLLNEKSSQNNK